MYNHEPKDYICPFCQIVKKEYDNQMTKEADIFYQDKELTAFVSPKSWPNNPGNVLIIPNRHFENIYDVPDVLLGRIFILAKKVAIAMKESYHCQGSSVRQHNEPAGNQDVWHFHVHVFARYADDRLYQLHDQKRWTTLEERRTYVEKLKEYFRKTTDKKQ